MAVLEEARGAGSMTESPRMVSPRTYNHFQDACEIVK